MRASRSGWSGGVSRSACSASSTAACGAPRRAALAAAAATVAASSASGCAAARARWRVRSSPSATTPARSRWSARRSPGLRLTHRRGSKQRMRRTDLVAVDHEHPGVDREIERVRLGQRRQLPDPERRAERHRQQEVAHVLGQTGHARAQQLLDVVGNRQVLADRRHAVVHHLAPELQHEQRVAERRVVEPAEHVARQGQAEPLREDAADRGRGSAVAPRRAPAASRRARARGPTGDPGVGRAGTPRARRRGGGRRRRARPPRPGRATGRRRRPRAVARAGPATAARRAGPSAIACGSGGAPVGCARRSATSSACRRGGGRVASSSSSTPSSRSISAANESRVWASLARAASTRSPRLRPASTAASQRVVLPIPGPPVRTSARGRTSDARNASSADSSASRPTIGAATDPFSPLD